MKILYIPGYRYPNSLEEPLTSGDLRYSFTLSRALAKLGHEVNVITRLEGDDPVLSQLDGVTIYRYKSELSKLFSTSFDISINRLNVFKKLQNDADLIICNTPLSLEHLMNIKAPVVYVASGLEDVKNYSFSPKEIIGYLAIKFLRDPMKRKTWKKSVLVNTTAWHEDETLIKWGIPASKVGKISSSIDTERFYPQKENGSLVRKELGIKSNQEVILSVSRFTPAKGLIETIKAFDKLNRQSARLVIVGVHHSHDNTYYTKVTEEIATSKNSKNILLLEDIPEHKLPAYYSMATVTSVFSKGYDPLPTVIIESMACGTPVISTYYKTREQFISDGKTGIFAKEKNIDEWVAKTHQLLDNNALKKRISEDALSHVRKNFDYIEIARKYIKVIEK